jgi:hypothetical protein
MRSNQTRRLGPALALLLFTATGCRDELPTLPGGDLFPDGALPTTIQHSVRTADFLIAGFSLPGTTGPMDAQWLVVANRFDGVLDANALARFGPFPDTLFLTVGQDTAFTYAGGRLVTTIADTLATSSDQLMFTLWALAQPFDTTATWAQRGTGVGGGAWTTPGGTRGELIGEELWQRADTAAVGDSLIWNLPPSIVEGLASERIHGLMVTLEDPNTRAEITRMSLRVDIRPSLQDTVLVRTIPSTAQTYVFSPVPPRPVNLFRVGGLTSERTYVRIALPEQLPNCPDPAAQACGTIPTRDVVLNRVELLLDPVPVTQGFRPLGASRVVIRRLLEPELGERAPLGPIVAVETISADAFVAPAGGPVSLAISGAVADALARNRAEVALALQVEPIGTEFGFTRYQPNPRLRFTYTLPQRPRLP